MGTFGGAGASALSPLIELAFAVTDDGTIGGQADNDQPTVESLLKQRMQDSSGWNGASGALFAGLPSGLPFVAGLIAKLAEQITGIDITDWLDDWLENPIIDTLEDIVQDALGSIFSVMANLQSMFGHLNFLSPDFDPAAAIEDFINLVLIPTNLIVGLIDGLIPDDFFGGFDASKIISGEFPMEMITGLLSFLADVPVVGTLLGWLGLDPDGDGGTILDWATSLIGPDSPLNAFNLFNIIPTTLIGLVGFSQIGNISPNLLANGGFQGAVSVQGNGIWTWNSTDGRTSNGCVQVGASGSEQRLLSNAIPVAEGDKLSHIIYAKWSGLTYTGTPFRTRIVRILDGAQVGIDNVSAPTSPGANQTSWYALTGSDYTVPSGCDQICYELTITATASAGTILFDDGEIRKTGKLQIPWTEDLPDSLQDLLDDWQSTLDGIFEGVTGSGGSGTLMADIIAALQNIPFFNVIGVGGPANIGDSVQSTWDQWISGLVGTPGTGAGLADLYNIGQDISSRSSRGAMAFDITAIRNNKDLKTGFLPTSVANLDLAHLTITPGTITVQQGTAITGYKRISEAIDIGAISWQGSGTSNITAFNANIYKMDETTGQNGAALHASADIKGILSSSMQQNVYSLPGDPVHFEPGDTAAFELTVTGTGTHTMLGGVSTLVDQAVYPRRWSSRRNSAGAAAPTSAWTPTYSNDVPFIEPAVSASLVPIPHSPETKVFDTVQSSTSYPIPSWVNTVQVVVFGGGGSGRQGGTYGICGQGGAAGAVDAIIWTRGLDFTGAAVLTITVPAAPQVGGGPGTGGVGGDGGDVVVSITGGDSVTGAGGGGGHTLLALGDPGRFGGSPGGYDLDGQHYDGAPEQTTLGAAGGKPGGGGAGGNWISFQNGGRGGLGAAFVRFKQ